MRKWCSRLPMLFVMAGFVFLVICETTGLTNRIIQAQDSSMLVKTLLATFGLLYPLSVFGVWGLMLYDWGTREFRTPSHKRRWFLALTLGMFVGVWIYYVVVFEMDGYDSHRKNGV